MGMVCFSQLHLKTECQLDWFLIADILIYFSKKQGGKKSVLTSHTQIHHLCRNNGYLQLHSLVFGRELQNKGDLKCKKNVTLL